MTDRSGDEYRPCRLETSEWDGEGTVVLWPGYWRSEANGSPGGPRGMGFDLTEARRLLAALPDAIAHAEAVAGTGPSRTWVLEDDQ